MRVRSWIGALVMGVALAPLPALAQAAKVDDGAITTRVETRLKASASLKHDDIKVETDNGVVTLTGTVKSQAERARAAQLATVTGVTRVENKLEVSPETAATTGRTGEKIEKKMDSAGDKTGKAMDKAVDKTGEGVGKAVDKTVDASKKVASKTKDVSKEGAGKTKDASKDVAGKTKDAASATGEAITDTWI